MTPYPTVNPGNSHDSKDSTTRLKSSFGSKKTRYLDAEHQSRSVLPPIEQQKLISPRLPLHVVLLIRNERRI